MPIPNLIMNSALVQLSCHKWKDRAAFIPSRNITIICCCLQRTLDSMYLITKYGHEESILEILSSLEMKLDSSL